MPDKRRILIVDDHAVFREGLSRILEREPDLAVCGAAEEANAGLDLCQSTKPDLVLLDITLPGMSGLELARMIRERHPALKILVLSMHKESLYAERALHAGANGYLMKHESGKTLVQAIRRALSGETVLSEEMQEILQADPQVRRQGESPVERLSEREFQVFALIARGYGTRQIADELHISAKTVETHREHIREKLHIQSTFDLVQYALSWSGGGNL